VRGKGYAILEHTTEADEGSDLTQKKRGVPTKYEPLIRSLRQKSWGRVRARKKKRRKKRKRIGKPSKRCCRDRGRGKGATQWGKSSAAAISNVVLRSDSSNEDTGRIEKGRITIR